jgi:hypothetical protein
MHAIYGKDRLPIMKTTRIIALFTLKPGVVIADYEAWARSVDIPVVNRLPSIASFEVFKAVGLVGSDAPPPYHYIEIVDVADMTQFGTDVATQTMQDIAAKFQSMADVTFILTEKLEAAP